MGTTEQEQLSIADQITLHKVTSQVPVKLRDGKIVPENTDNAEKSLAELAPDQPYLIKKMNELFAQNSQDIGTLPPAGITPPDQKKFFMIDPHEISQGLPYNLRVAEYKKWAIVGNLIEHAGGEVSTLRGANEDGGKRETFTRDRYVLIDGTAYIPDSNAYINMATKAGVTLENARTMGEAYESEIQQTKNFLESQNVPVKKVEGSWFEGGNIIVDHKTNTIFMGLETDRDNRQSAQKLVDVINSSNSSKYSLIGIPLVNQSVYYHLDLGMSDALPKGNEIMLSPHLTDPLTLEIIKEKIGKDRVIMLDENEPVGTTNLVSPSGNNLVLTTATPERMADLSQRGYHIIQNRDMGDLTLAAGGVRCMANELPSTENKNSVMAPAR